jgi:hypothetical protein
MIERYLCKSKRVGTGTRVAGWRSSLTEEVVVGLALILEVQSSVADMVQVLQPLKVGDSHTTSVHIQIRNDEDLAVSEDLVSSQGSGTIGTLGNDLQSNGIKI